VMGRMKEVDALMDKVMLVCDTHKVCDVMYALSMILAGSLATQCNPADYDVICEEIRSTVRLKAEKMWKLMPDDHKEYVEKIGRFRVNGPRNN